MGLERIAFGRTAWLGKLQEREVEQTSPIDPRFLFRSARARTQPDGLFGPALGRCATGSSPPLAPRPCGGYSTRASQIVYWGVYGLASSASNSAGRELVWGIALIEWVVSGGNEGVEDLLSGTA